MAAEALLRSAYKPGWNPAVTGFSANADVPTRTAVERMSNRAFVICIGLRYWKTLVLDDLACAKTPQAVLDVNLTLNHIERRESVSMG